MSDLRTKLEALKNNLEQKLLDPSEDSSRVVEELHNLAGQFYAGTLLRHLAGVFIWVCAYMAIFVLFGAMIGVIVCGDAKNGTCHLLGGAECRGTCSNTVYGEIFLLTVIGGVTALGSYNSAVRTKNRRLQNSALVTAVLVVVSGFALFYLGSSLLFGLIVTLTIFIASFLGYKLSFGRGH